MLRQILADYDDVGIHVYQAFNAPLVDAALAQGTFAGGFNLQRMTWIKPSFGWMLHRSGFATAHNQERILKIKLPHAFFLKLLRAAVLSSYVPECYSDERTWKEALQQSPIRCQWDPDRNWRDDKLDRRAIQLGIAGELVREYVAAVVALQDVTALAHQCALQAPLRVPPPGLPDERVYPVPADIATRLGVDDIPS